MLLCYKSLENMYLLDISLSNYFNPSTFFVIQDTKLSLQQVYALLLLLDIFFLHCHTDSIRLMDQISLRKICWCGRNVAKPRRTNFADYTNQKNVSKSYVGHCSAAEQKVTRQAYQTRVPLFVYQHSRGKFCEISALTTTAALPPKDGNLPHLRGDFR